MHGRSNSSQTGPDLIGSLRRVASRCQRCMARLFVSTLCVRCSLRKKAKVRLRVLGEGKVGIRMFHRQPRLIRQKGDYPPMKAPCPTFPVCMYLRNIYIYIYTSTLLGRRGRKQGPSLPASLPSPSAAPNLPSFFSSSVVGEWVGGLFGWLGTKSRGHV